MAVAIALEELAVGAKALSSIGVDTEKIFVGVVIEIGAMALLAVQGEALDVGEAVLPQPL